MSAVTTSRSTAVLNVYLILEHDGKILLSKRKNTGYFDGYFSLVAGHVEDSESASCALIREAYEEIGISINLKDIELVHTMHRKTNRNNLDLFFKCYAWQGDIENKEENKCEALQFCQLNNFPENTIPYIQQALEHISKKLFYSEIGWND